MKKIILYIIIFVFSSSFIFAASGDPTCFLSNTSVKTACVGGNAGVGNFTGNVTTKSVWIIGYGMVINATGHWLGPTVTAITTWAGISDKPFDTLNTSQIVNSSGGLSINQTYWATKLDTTDQRYNETTYIDGKIANVSSGYSGLFINYTPITTTGNITNGSLSGYKAANAICSSYYAGSHMCSGVEILDSINNNISNQNFTATFRVSTGYPGYLAAAEDCEGYTSAVGTYLGAIWVGSKTHTNTYGQGALDACNAERAIGCCK